MKNLIFLLLLSISLVGCNSGHPTNQSPSEDETYIIQSTYGSDGYYLEQSSIVNTDIQLKVHMYRSKEEFLNAAIEHHQKPKTKGGEIMGFTYWTEDTCTMYIYDPAFYYGPETIGHELVHCIYGDFHPSQPKEDNEV